MDKITKIIHLEEAKNRTPNALPYYMYDESSNTCVLQYDSNTWGGYCVDVLIPKTSNENLPLLRWANKLSSIYHFQEVEVTNDNGVIVAYWLRYKNLMMLYRWLINVFIPSINFYTKCDGEFKNVSVNDSDLIFDSNVLLFNTLFDAEEAGVEEGEIVAITDLYGDLLKKFIDIETVKEFLMFIDKLLKNGLFSPLSGATPYIDVAFSMDSKYEDLGIMTPLIENWVPKKKYYLGESVLRDNTQYQLQKCEKNSYDKYELVGSLLDAVLDARERGDERYIFVNNEHNIPSKCFDLSLSPFISSNNGKKISYAYCILEEKNNETGLISYYLIQPYYNGSYVNGQYCFDINEEHWRKQTVNKNYCSFFRNENDEIAYQCQPMRENTPEITGITESKLIALKRKVTSVDDFGEVLPFIIIDGSIYGDLYYSIGITNETKYSDCWRGDELTQIRYKEFDGEYTNETTINTVGAISSDDFIYEEGIAEFTYYIGSQLDVEINGDNITKSRIDYTGVKYVEEWCFIKEEKTVRIDGDDVLYIYIKFYPKENNEYITNNLDINGKTPIYSIVTYYGKEAMSNDEIHVQNFKDENLLGIQDINMLKYDLQSDKYVNAIDCRIERGIATAFERHNILGEVKSFADLENYRNNFFGI